MKKLLAAKACTIGAQCKSTCISKNKKCQVELSDSQKNNIKNRVAAIKRGVSSKPALDENKKPKVLGEGAFSTVYLNIDGSVTKRFEGQELSLNASNRFIKREAKMQEIAAKIGIAPKVLGVKNRSITMEKAVGKPVGPDPTQEQKIAIRAAVLKLHKLNITHNDLHGQNIFWDGKKITIIDYGLAESKFEGNRYYEYKRRVRLDDSLDDIIKDAASYKAWLKTQ